MDEATLKITLVDEGGQGAPPPSSPIPAPSMQPPEFVNMGEQRVKFASLDEAVQQRILEEMGRQNLADVSAKSAGAVPAFDPVEQARKLLDLEERRRQVEEAREQLLREQGKWQEEQVEQFDPYAEVARQNEAAERKRQIEAARRSQEQGVSFDDALQGIRDEEAKAKEPPPPFDPTDAARKQAESEARGRQVREEYLANERPDQAVAQVAGAAGMGNVAQLASSLGAMSMAAGPVGAAVAGIQALGAASDLAAGLMNQATRGIQQMGTMAVQVAGNDYLGAFRTGVEGTAQALEQLPVVGGALGAAMRLATAPVMQFTRVVESFVDRGAELARFSADITAARAVAGARSTMGDIKEADQLGAGIASLTDSSSQVLADIRDMLLPIKKFVVDTLAGIMEGVAAVMEVIGAVVTPIAEGVGALLGLLRDIIGTFLKPIFETLKLIAKAVRWIAGREDKVENPSGYMQKILDEIQNSFNEENAAGAVVGGGAIGALGARGSKFMEDIGGGNLNDPIFAGAP